MTNRSASPIQAAKNQSAFTLLEVLITLIILAIGLLGLAGLQAISLQNNHSAYHRSQATIIAYDMIDRIRANQAAINNYVTTLMLPTAAVAQNGCIAAAGCSITQMAQNDLFEWNAAIVAAFPAGAGTISTGVSGTYMIRIIWLDDRQNNATTQFDVSFLP